MRCKYCENPIYGHKYVHVEHLGEPEKNAYAHERCFRLRYPKETVYRFFVNKKQIGEPSAFVNDLMPYKVKFRLERITA